MSDPKFINGGIGVDDRGSVRYHNEFNLEKAKIQRFYQLENLNTTTIRGMHGHKKEVKYLYVPKGTAKIVAKKMKENGTIGPAEIFTLSDKKPGVLYVPSNYYNGVQALEKDTIVLVFSTLSLAESLGDDYRIPVELEDFEVENR